MSAQEAREVKQRRLGDRAGDGIRREAIAYVWDGSVDRSVRCPCGARLTLAQVERICREYEARVRALGGGW